MRCPERRIDETYSWNLYIIAIGNVHQSWTQLIHIGTFRNDGTAQPERFPIAQTVTVDGAFAGDGETIDSVSIHQCGEILQWLPLYAGIDYGEIADIIATFQYGSFFQIKMGFRFEEKRTTQVSTFRDDDYATAFGRSLVDDRLNLFCLNQGAIIYNAIICNLVLVTQCFNIYDFVLSEPVGNRSSVRKILLCERGQAEK